MSRRRILATSLAQRDAVRAQAVNARAARAAERTRAAYERAKRASEKEQRRLYLEARAVEVQAMNEQLVDTVEGLERLLADAIAPDSWLDFESLKMPLDIAAFDPGSLAKEEQLPDPKDYAVPELSRMKALMPGAKDKHAAEVAAARAAFLDAVGDHHRREDDRKRRLGEAKAKHEKWATSATAESRRQHAEVDQFRSEFESGDPDAILSYFDLVLRASPYPDTFPRRFRLAFIPESRQLVIEFELPPITVIPAVKSYRFTKSKDEVATTARPASQIKALYAAVVAQIALRTLHEVYEADRTGHIETTVFNGMLDTVDRSTGHPIRPCLVTVRTTREAFAALDLANVDSASCLKHLGAGVSRSPTELLPVRPVLEFDMVDKRFVEETDVLTGLDERPNLMELTPGEFENLITNLFAKMGLETRQTQASRDGGVDCVAFDNRPIMGGKVVIQAKRYRGTVGVSAVRDLYGTVHNEGASKGILVATSGYGKAAFEFAINKPLELISGSELLFLLSEHAGVDARIEPPEDWVDPAGASLA